MKIYTQLVEEEIGALSAEAIATRRWTESSLDIGGGVRIVSATVSDDQIDFIRTRQAREDGGWSKEVCLFPGAKLSSMEAL